MKIVNKLRPEGFAQLVEYLKDREEGKAEANEIQTSLQKKHGFSSGKVTGIITRATEQKVIVKLDRGLYKLCPDILSSQESNISNFILVVNNEIDLALSKIEAFVGRNFTQMQNDDLDTIKKKLKGLKEVRDL